MARRRALCRAFEQFAVTARDSQGLAIARHPTKTVWAPALYAYCGDFEVKDSRSVNKAWCLVLVDDGAPIHPDAQADPDIQPIPASLQLDDVLTGARLTAARNWVNSTDLDVTLTSGMTVRQALKAIGTAMGHTPAFNGDGD